MKKFPHDAVDGVRRNAHKRLSEAIVEDEKKRKQSMTTRERDLQMRARLKGYIIGRLGKLCVGCGASPDKEKGIRLYLCGRVMRNGKSRSIGNIIQDSVWRGNEEWIMGVVKEGNGKLLCGTCKNKKHLIKDFETPESQINTPEATGPEGVIMESPSTPTSHWSDPLYANGNVPTRDQIVAVFGLFTKESLPRPGEAKNWSKRDWTRWCLDNGMKNVSRAKHGEMYEHTIFKTLRTCIMEDGNDPCGSMANATKFRTDVLSITDYIVLIVVSSPRELIKRYTSVQEAIEKIVGDDSKEFEKLTSDIQKSNGVMVQNIEKSYTGSTLELTAVFNTLKNDFDFGIARLMSHPLMGALTDTLCEALRSYLNPPCNIHVPIPDSFVEVVRSILAYERDEEKRIKDEKRAKREEERTKNEKDTTAKESVAKAIADNNKRYDSRIEAIEKAAHYAIQLAQNLRKSPPQPQIPDFEDPVPLKKKLAEQDDMMLKAATHIQELNALIETLKTTPPATVVDSSTKEHLLAFAEIVKETVEKAKTMVNPFQIVDAMNGLAKEADAVISAEKAAAAAVETTG